MKGVFEDMEQFLKRIENLMTVKSIVTLALTAVFACQAVRGEVSQDFMMIYTTVIAFYFGTQAQKLAHFVGLQMADKVPPYFSGESRHFLCELLHTALAEADLAGGISLGNHFSRMELRYSHQRDTLGKFLLNLPDILGNTHSHTLIIYNQACGASGLASSFTFIR